ncbi:hypothetical protein ACFIJ5_16840 [Haloimpatiens sp. FM7330]|uniref:putative ABC transporter permease subunit n=1 Tax=Haloimpatiens sp. FM7330 TaxID=3298610 RepID=UPI00362A5127
MNKWWILTKIFLKSGDETRSQNKSKIFSKKIVLYAILAIALLPLIMMIGKGASALYDILSKFNQEGIILGIGFALNCLIIFVFGIFYAMNTLYFSMDIENILPLPFKSWHIISAKLTTVLIYEYLTEAVFFVPLVISYGLKSGGGLLYYLYSIIVFVTIPIIPLVLSSLIVMLIMGFTGFARNKDRFRKISGLVGLALALGFNFYIQKLSSSSITPEQVNSMINIGNNSFISIVTTIFPTAKLAALGVVNNSSALGITNILMFLGITFAVLGLFLIISEKLYFKGVLGVSETSSKRKKLSSEELEKTSIKQSVLISYTKKELRLLFRTPTYFYNCVIMNFLWPVFFIIPMMANSNRGLTLSKISSFLNNTSYQGIVIAASFAFMLFVGGANAIAATSISREGKDIFICKFLPISYRTQIMAKVLSSIVMGIMSEIIMLIVAIIVLKMPVVTSIIIAILGVLAITFISMIGVFVDLNHPKLKWENEQKAVKQNINPFFQMIISWVSIAGLIAGVLYFDLGLIKTIAFILLVFGGITIILYKIIAIKGEKIFSSIEC